MGHACLHRHNVRFGIAYGKQGARKLYALARFHQLASNKAFHCLLVDMVTQQIAMLFLANELCVKKHIPVPAHFSANRGIKQHSISLALIAFAKNKSLIFQAIVLDVGTRDNVVDLIIAA